MFHNHVIAQLAALHTKAETFRANADACSITTQGNEDFKALTAESGRCERQARELADSVKTPRQRHADRCRRVMLRVAYAMRGPRRRVGRAELMRAEWRVEKQFA